MKNLFFFIMLALFASSCKKEGSGGDDKWLLSKVYFNGLLDNEYIYNTSGRLIRVIYYSTGGGTSTLSTSQLYEYNADGTVKEIRNFSSEYKPTKRLVYTYSQGRITRMDEASIFTGSADLSIMDFYEIFSYDANGLLKNIVRRHADHSNHSRKEFTYDDQGKLATASMLLEVDDEMEIKEYIEVNAGAKAMPAHWKENLITPTDYQWYDLMIPSKKYTSYWSVPAGTLHIWSYTDRQYNDDGYVVKQIEKLEAYGAVNTNERTFEYVK
jgi:hypothetical protein